MLTIILIFFTSLSYAGEIHDYIANNKYSKIRKAIKADPDLLNEKNSVGKLPIVFAAEMNNMPAVYLLQKLGAEINSSASGKTVLDIVAEKRHTKMNLSMDGLSDIHKLITDLKAHPYDDTRAFELVRLAINHDDTKLLSKLYPEHPDFPKRNAEGDTLLNVAIRTKKIKAAKYLIEKKGLDVNLQTQEKSTLLHAVVEFWEDHPLSHKRTFIKYLLSKGADPNIKNKIGLTPAEMSSQKGESAIASILEGKEGLVSKCLNAFF